MLTERQCFNVTHGQAMYAHSEDAQAIHTHAVHAQAMHTYIRCERPLCECNTRKKVQI